MLRRYSSKKCSLIIAIFVSMSILLTSVPLRGQSYLDSEMEPRDDLPNAPSIIITASGVAAGVAVVTLVGAVVAWALAPDNFVTVWVGQEGHDCNEAGYGDGDQGSDWARKRIWLHDYDAGCGDACAYGFADAKWGSGDIVKVFASEYPIECPHGLRNDTNAEAFSQADYKKGFRKSAQYSYQQAGLLSVVFEMQIDTLSCIINNPSLYDTATTQASIRYTMHFLDPDYSDTLTYEFQSTIEARIDAWGNLSTFVEGDIPESAFTLHEGAGGSYGLSLLNYMFVDSFKVEDTRIDTLLGIIDAFSQGCASAGSCNHSQPSIAILADSIYFVECGMPAAYVPFALCNANVCADPTIYEYNISCSPLEGDFCSGFPREGVTDPILGGDCDGVYAVINAGSANYGDKVSLEIIAWDQLTGSAYDTCVQLVQIVEPRPVPLITTPVVLVLAIILAAAVILKNRPAI